MEVLAALMGDSPPPKPFPKQKKEECHKNQALHAGFQCTDGRKHTAGAGNPVSFKTFILHAERRPRGSGQAAGSVGHHGYAHMRRHPEVMRALHVRSGTAYQQGKTVSTAIAGAVKMPSTDIR